MPQYSIYIHIPFCQKRCSYCDFNTYAGQELLIPDYLNSLKWELRYLATKMDEPLLVHTIFIGGGTPSILDSEDIRSVLEVIQESYDLQVGAEISLEANPGTLTQAKLVELQVSGVNRLSLGVQSANPNELQFLGRQHDYTDVIDSVKWSRQAGFKNLNLDLIFGIPGQSMDQWETTLNQAIRLSPEHFSLYALTIEPETSMSHWKSRGLISIPDSDLAADMYEIACENLDEAGYTQYEISNFAKTNCSHQLSENPLLNPDFACRHNLQYWRNLEYLGIGAGAHGYADGQRYSVVRTPEDYIQKLVNFDGQTEFRFPCTPAKVDSTVIDLETEMRETMMMGLRLTREGVDDSKFQNRFGNSLRTVFKDEVCKLLELELVEWVGDVLRITSRGRLLGNQVFLKFV